MRTLNQQFRHGTHWAVQASRLGLLFVTVVFGLLSVTGRMPELETQTVIYLVGMVALNRPHGGYEHFEDLRGGTLVRRTVRADTGFWVSTVSTTSAVTPTPVSAYRCACSGANTSPTRFGRT